MSVASVIAALVVPLLAFLRGDPSPLVLAAGAAALLIMAAHRTNLSGWCKDGIPAVVTLEAGFWL